MDTKQRKLERAALMGDPEAQATLEALKIRTGAHKPDRIVLKASHEFCKVIREGFGGPGKYGVTFVKRDASDTFKLRSYWSGGSRDEWYAWDTNNKRVTFVPAPGCYPFDQRPDFEFTLETQMWLVNTGHFCGKRKRPTVYVPSDAWDTIPWDASDAVALSNEHKLVLYVQRALIAKVRKAELESFGFSDARVKRIRDELVSKGCMKRHGRGFRLTTKGRNAIGTVYKHVRSKSYLAVAGSMAQGVNELRARADSNGKVSMKVDDIVAIFSAVQDKDGTRDNARKVIHAIEKKTAA